MLLWWVCKSSFFIGWLCMNRKIGLFRKTKMFLLQKICLNALKSDTLQQTKRFSFTQAFPYCPFRKKPFPPSISHLHPAITYCPLKNDAVLVISALTPYAVTPEPRTDSKPFRRRLVRKTGFDSCRRKTLLKASSIEL